MNACQLLQKYGPLALGGDSCTIETGGEHDAGKKS
jgi:hypothetical protein